MMKIPSVFSSYCDYIDSVLGSKMDVFSNLSYKFQVPEIPVVEIIAIKSEGT